MSIVFGFLKPDGAQPAFWNVLQHSYLRPAFGKFRMVRPLLLTPRIVQELYEVPYRRRIEARRGTVHEMGAFIRYMCCAPIYPFLAAGDPAAAKELVRRIRADLLKDPQGFPNLIHVADPDAVERECKILRVHEAYMHFRELLAHEGGIPSVDPPLHQDRDRTSGFYLDAPHAATAL